MERRHSRTAWWSGAERRAPRPPSPSASCWGTAAGRPQSRAWLHEEEKAGKRVPWGGEKKRANKRQSPLRAEGRPDPCTPAGWNGLARSLPSAHLPEESSWCQFPPSYALRRFWAEWEAERGLLLSPPPPYCARGAVAAVWGARRASRRPPCERRNASGWLCFPPSSGGNSLPVRSGDVRGPAVPTPGLYLPWDVAGAPAAAQRRGAPRDEQQRRRAGPGGPRGARSVAGGSDGGCTAGGAGRETRRAGLPVWGGSEQWSRRPQLLRSIELLSLRRL